MGNLDDLNFIGLLGEVTVKKIRVKKPFGDENNALVRPTSHLMFFLAH